MGKTVLHISPTMAEKRFLAESGARAVSVDIRPEVSPDLVVDLCSMETIDDDSFDYVYASVVLGVVYDLAAALSEIRRVLKKSGAYFSAEILYEGAYTRLVKDVDEQSKWYGKEVLSKYRVGAFRRFGSLDYGQILARFFDIREVKLHDEATGRSQSWFVCTK